MNEVDFQSNKTTGTVGRLVSQHDTFAECTGRQTDSARLEPFHERGSDAGRHKVAHRTAILVHALLVVAENVLHHDRVLFHAHQLGDMGHLPRATLQAV